MKSPRYNVSFPSEVQEDLASVSLKLGVSVSEYIRRSTIESLMRLTKKKYTSITWGGVRGEAGRKPSKPAVRASAEGNVSSRSRTSAKKSDTAS